MRLPTVIRLHNPGQTDECAKDRAFLRTTRKRKESDNCFWSDEYVYRQLDSGEFRPGRLSHQSGNNARKIVDRDLCEEKNSEHSQLKWEGCPMSVAEL